MSTLCLVLLLVDVLLTAGCLVLGGMLTERAIERRRHAFDQAALTKPWPPPAPTAPPAAAPKYGLSQLQEQLAWAALAEKREPTPAVDHLGEMIALLGKAVEGLSMAGNIQPMADPYRLAAERRTLDPANFDWDPTDSDPDLIDPAFSRIVPDRPQVGDAPDLETNPYGIPGLSWPPAPGDVVS